MTRRQVLLCHCAGAGLWDAQQGEVFDMSIGLPLPGSLEPFNPTCLALTTPGFAQCPELPGSSSSLWGEQDDTSLPAQHSMSSSDPANPAQTALTSATDESQQIPVAPGTLAGEHLVPSHACRASV